MAAIGHIEPTPSLARAWMLARYDCGALPAAVADLLKQIECDIAWQQHRSEFPTAWEVSRQTK
jgi:hypothetical protein